MQNKIMVFHQTRRLFFLHQLFTDVLRLTNFSRLRHYTLDSFSCFETFVILFLWRRCSAVQVVKPILLSSCYLQSSKNTNKAFLTCGIGSRDHICPPLASILSSTKAPRTICWFPANFISAFACICCFHMSNIFKIDYSEMTCVWVLKLCATNVRYMFILYRIRVFSSHILTSRTFFIKALFLTTSIFWKPYNLIFIIRLYSIGVLCFALFYCYVNVVKSYRSTQVIQFASCSRMRVTYWFIECDREVSISFLKKCLLFKTRDILRNLHWGAIKLKRARQVWAT